MMDVNQTYCCNHFMMCVNQIIILYILNILYNAISQLYLNKNRKKKTKSHRKKKNKT